MKQSDFLSKIAVVSIYETSLPCPNSVYA